MMSTKGEFKKWGTMVLVLGALSLGFSMPVYADRADEIQSEIDNLEMNLEGMETTEQNINDRIDENDNWQSQLYSDAEAARNEAQGYFQEVQELEKELNGGWGRDEDVILIEIQIAQDQHDRLMAESDALLNQAFAITDHTVDLYYHLENIENMRYDMEDRLYELQDELDSL